VVFNSRAVKFTMSLSITLLEVVWITEHFQF